MRLNADIIVVGSGVGGATLAKELAKSGKKILVVEKGHSYPTAHLGSELSAYHFYDKHGLWSRTKEGIFYYRTIMTGGTSVVACGNGVRSLEKELKKLGIDLKKELKETEKELGIRRVPASHLGKGTRLIMQASRKLGIKMSPMPKFINFKKCVSCGNCILGCRTGAKWSALDYLQKARRRGVTFLERININKVLISKGRATGAEGHDNLGRKVRISAKIVVLSAGGIGTPVILQKSGIKAGGKLFLDLFNVTFGLSKDLGIAHELTMAAVNHQNGFILSPFIDHGPVLVSVVPLPLRKNLSIASHRKHMLGIMVKIKDDMLGKVNKDGSIEKKLSAQDSARLKNGTNIARKILIKAGVNPKTIITTKVRGAHPGGTAAIGEVVNKNLETKIKGLFVCDASVLPVSPGLPPIVTIVSLAKRLGKLLKKYF